MQQAMILKQKKRILFVDDDILLHNIFKNKLKNFDIQFAENINDSINLLKEQNYSIIFLDYDLSITDTSINSIPIAEYIRDNNIDIKVIIMTGNVLKAKKLQDIIGEFKSDICDKAKLAQNDNIYLYVNENTL